MPHYNSTRSTHMEGLVSSSIYGALAALPLHLMNILSIIINRKLLRQNVYLLLLNLSITDMLLILHFRLMLQFGLVVYRITVIIARLFHSASILFTCVITLDRYLKVEYCLTYHTIAAKRRLFLLVIAVWGLSVVFSGVSWLVELDQRVNGVTIHRLFLICGGVLMIGSSFWVWHVRNKHLKEIRKRNQYFGASGEEYNVLRNMRKVIVEILRLNIVTALLILSACVTHLVGMVLVAYFLETIYMCSNPLVYMVVMVDLRKHYFRCCRLLRSRSQRSVSPASETHTTRSSLGQSTRVLHQNSEADLCRHNCSEA